MKDLNLTPRKIELLENMIQFCEDNWTPFCILHEERTGTDEFVDDDMSELRDQVYR